MDNATARDPADLLRAGFGRTIDMLGLAAGTKVMAAAVALEDRKPAFNFSFTRPTPPPAVSFAEFQALKIIVQAHLAVNAHILELATGQPARSTINNLGVTCQEAIADGTMSASLQSDVVGAVNAILGAIHFPADDRGMN